MWTRKLVVDGRGHLAVLLSCTFLRSIPDGEISSILHFTRAEHSIFVGDGRAIALSALKLSYVQMHLLIASAHESRNLNT